MKSLFNKDYKYTPEAELLDKEANDALKSLFDIWRIKGHNPREISNIIKWAVNDIELESILGWIDNK